MVRQKKMAAGTGDGAEQLTSRQPGRERQEGLRTIYTLSRSCPQ
jgi:hypothetical protein